MADIHIRQVSDELYRALKVRAAEQGITLKAYLLPFMEQAAGGKFLPSWSPTTGAVTPPQHTGNCKCATCKPVKK